MIMRFFLAQIEEGDVDIPKVPLSESSISTAISLALGIAGGIALIIMVIAAIQYTLSQGEPQATARAKDTILYALIGLVVIVIAFSIVRFTTGRVL